MFSSAAQPPIVSLFSSTGTDPLALFTSSVDASLPSDSFIHILHDHHSTPLPSSPRALVSLPAINGPGGDSEDLELQRFGRELDQTVLHIQSPTMQTTYIHCPPVPSVTSGGITGSQDRFNSINDLGIRHQWMHVQARNLGREWGFEIGLVDQAKRMGIIRLATFQKRPRLKLSITPGGLPLLLLPLNLPSAASRPLTGWTTATIHLPTILPFFSSPALRTRTAEDADDDNSDDDVTAPSAFTQPNVPLLPSGTYSHVSYVRVYATCRLRRIWFSDGGPGQHVPFEFELFSV